MNVIYSTYPLNLVWFEFDMSLFIVKSMNSGYDYVCISSNGAVWCAQYAELPASDIPLKMSNIQYNYNKSFY